MRRSLITLASLLALAGCTLGPDPTAVPPSVADGATAFVGAAERPEGPPIDTWWQGFGDEVTAGLVEQALAGNTDLRAASARLAAAEAGLAAARGSLWPEASLTVGASRQKSSFVLPQVGRVGVLSTTYSDDLLLSYELDLFGREARGRQAATADLAATGAARDATLHRIVAAVVRSRATLATLEGRLTIARSTAESWRDSVDLVERRYRSGLLPALDVHLARQSLASAESSVVQLERAIAQAGHALDVLVGRRPGTGDRLPIAPSSLPDLDPPPVGLPADLLERRPDVVVARMRFAAATARVGVALADLFPSLRLTGSAGARSDELSDLVSSDGLIYNLVGNLVTPLFAGGRLRASVEAARARADQAAADYAGTVLVALREVEDALVAEETRRAELGHLEVAAREARAAARVASRRYEEGTGNLLAFLETQRRLFLADTTLTIGRGAIWDARIDLFLALGGDWYPTPSDSESTTSPEMSS